MKITTLIIAVYVLTICSMYGQNDVELWKDHTKPIDERVNDLISKLTLEEKISQLIYESKAIDRLGIPYYNWWNECLHGVARGGKATVFPQPIGLGATFDTDLLNRVGTAISDEARAIYHNAINNGQRYQYGGITFWTPNVNLFRDPRWGRGMETYGEDPVLMSQLGISFMKGLQGDHPKYLKTSACGKHFVVHSGPEGDRHHFNAKSNKKDLYESYLPAFKALVDNGVESIMCAYNRTNDQPCCGSNVLLTEILRDELNFKGHIVSDCWAIRDFHEGHKVTITPAESAALAAKNSVNLNCGDTYPYLGEAVKQGLINEQTINDILFPLLKTRFKLGMFDPDELNPYASIGTDIIHCNKHIQLAREAAQKSIVLLKNKDNTLPLKKDIGNLFVLGPNASKIDVLLGNYYGLSENLVTILEGIVEKVSNSTIMQYRQGFLLDRKNINPIDWASSEASMADATIVVMGISPLLEGEEGEAIASPDKGDRFNIGIPQSQVEYLKTLHKKLKEKNKKLIVVLTGGSPIIMPEVHELADAVLFAWYSGEQGGSAVADVLFGDVAPSGKLPLTFPKSMDQLPPYDDYSMEGRTYRYMTEDPMYPFGYGLSYSQFTFTNLSLGKEKVKRGGSLSASVTVSNTGNFEAEEVVQLYLKDIEASAASPISALKDFKRVALKPGQSKTIEFTITPEMMMLVDNNGKSILEKGLFKVIIGGSSPGKRSTELGAPQPVEKEFYLK